MRVATSVVILFGAVAHADDAPRDVASAGAMSSSIDTSRVRAVPPWIVPNGGLRLDLTAEADVSDTSAGKPFALAPDLWYGATDDLTLGIVESKFATTGFRGSAGGGLCLKATYDGCPNLYNNVGVEGWVALVRGRVSLVAGGGFEATDLSHDFYALKLGIKSRIALGRVAIVTAPSIFFAATERDAAKPNRDMLYAPISISTNVTSRVALALVSGVKGPLHTLDSDWQVPLGVSASYSAGVVAVGTSFVFGTLFAGSSNPPPPAAPTEGTALRVVQVWMSFSTSAPAKRRHTPEISIARAPPAAPAPPRPSAPPHVVAAALAPPDPKPEPTAEPEPAFAAEPGVDLVSAETVAALANDHRADIAACSGSHELTGEVSIAFHVNTKGHVAKTVIASTIRNIEVSDCLLHVVRGWEFPEPPSGSAAGVYKISYK